MEEEIDIISVAKSTKKLRSSRAAVVNEGLTGIKSAIISFKTQFHNYNEMELGNFPRAVDHFFVEISELMATTEFNYAGTYGSLRIAVYTVHKLSDACHKSSGNDGDLLKSIVKVRKNAQRSSQSAWIKALRSLGGTVRHVSALSLRQGDSVSLSCCFSALLLEVTKLELLLVSLPDPDARVKALRAGCEVLGGILTTALTLKLDWDVFKGISAAASLALSYYQRSMAKAVSDIFLRFENVAMEVCTGMFNTNDSNPPTVEWVKAKVKEVIDLEKEDYFTGPIGSQRWEIYGAYALLRTEIIMCLSPVGNLRLQVHNFFHFFLDY